VTVITAFEPFNDEDHRYIAGSYDEPVYLCNISIRDMTVANDYNISLEILQYLGEVVAEVTRDGLIKDVLIRDKEKYPGEEERYCGNMLSDIHPAHVAEQFLDLIDRALKTRKSTYLEFQTSYKKQLAVYSVRVLPFHPDSEHAYFIIDDITSKDRIELLENRWKIAMDAAGDGMWDVNLVDNTIQFSDKWFEMSGYSRYEISGDVIAWSNKIFPSDLQVANKALADYLEGKTSFYHTEFRFKCKDGNYRWLLSRGVIIGKTTEGKPLRMIGTHTNIDEQKKAEQLRNEFEEQLKQQKEFYEHILNWLPGDIAVLDPHYRFLFLNEHSIKDKELREWMIGKTDEDYCRFRNKPIDMAERRQQFYHRVAEEKLQHEWEETFINAAGEKGHKLRRLHPVLNDEGDVRLLVGYGVDITDKVEAEEALRTSNEIFTNAFEHSGIGMALVSPFGKWLNVNSSVCDITEYSKDELLSKTFQEITHPDDLTIDLEFLKQMLNKEIETYNLEKRYISKLNKIVWVSLTVSMVWNSDGSPKFFIAQIIDITKKKQLTDEINRKNAELEAAKASLVNKIQQLEELNYLIAHNLRGPARNIQMLAAALNAKQGVAVDESIASISEAFTNEEAIGLIGEGADALTESLDTLMEVAKISLNKNIQYERCDVEQIINAILCQLNGTIYEKQADVKLRLAVGHIDYPKVYLESILYNFISNALKYVRQDARPDITVSTASENGKTVLSIKDNGLGIDLDRYGDRLFKLNQVFHSGFDSKGVGLFLTKSQIEALGGSIDVKSKVGEGTVFTVTL
jgi:PAS domain S-box-containing protein